MSASQYCPNFLASVTKNLTDSVNTYVTAAAKGTFPTGSYIGTLANNGTGLVLGTTLGPEGAGGTDDPARHGQGRHHQRQDQDHVAEPADVIAHQRTI